VAVLGFLVFAGLILVKATSMLEPDDFAYRASIVALRHGHILLSNSQYTSLNKQLASTGGQGILQWHHLSSGKWISEKNPGYPFVAVLFYAIGLLRVAPLFYGALAATGLYAGARKWLGGWAGTFAVLIFCFSGAALTFAWRDTMPSFTDASLIAAGFGALLWALLSTDAPARRRRFVGLAAFVALEAAVFIRYTNIIELGVAVIAVLAVAKATRLGWSTVASWLTTVAVFVGLVLSFDRWAYGTATSTGYSPGEITFSWSSLVPNLRAMPRDLTTSMPMWLLAFGALVWIAFNLAARRGERPEATEAKRDAVIGAVLASGWLALWILYLSYTWTVGQASGGFTVHVIRFYLPALGLIALLATWLVVRLARPAAWGVIGVLTVCAVLSFNAMSSNVPSHAVPTGRGPGPGGGVSARPRYAPPVGSPSSGSMPGNGAPPSTLVP